MGARGIRDDQPPLPREPGKPLLLLLVSQIALALVIAATTALLVVNLRQQALIDAEREQGNLSLILANHAERAFEAVELVQTAIQERLQNNGVRTPEAFRQVMSDPAVQEELHRRGSTLPQLDAIVISDADGNLINSSRSGLALQPMINIADRDFFEGLKAHPERPMFISEPVHTRSTGKWTAYIARQVRSPDGVFIGVIQGALELSYFEQLYHAVIPGPGAAIALYRRDGRLLARYPHIDATEETTVAQSKYFRILRATGANSIVLREVGIFDGQERLITGRSLIFYPIVVTVTNTISSILAGWRTQAGYLIGSAIILEMVVAAVGVLMQRQLGGQRMLTQAYAARAEAETSRLGAEAELEVARVRERADQELGIQNVRFVAALSNMSQALCMFDKAGTLIVANRRLAEMFDLPAHILAPGVTVESFLERKDHGSNLNQTDRDSMRSSIKQLKTAGIRATRIRELADGRTLSVNFVPVEDGGWLLTLEDITEHRLAAAKITHMAHHDALTGLPNRIFFHDKLTEAVVRSRRGESSAVLYLDLDHFKAVNDTLGHPVGDALLQAITLRLRAQIRETDTVARLGGDEFAIVQSSVNQPQDATALAGRLIEVLGAPYEIDGHHVTIDTSIGIAIIPTDGENPDQILKNADMALYRAKADGRRRYCFFMPEMDARMQARRTLEIDLRKALVAGEFEMFYQPLMNLKTGSVTGFEALMRWFHPQRGMVAPGEFIPLAEEIGLLVPLGEWALRQACFDAVTWPGAIKVAVNVSVTQFASRTLVEDVAAALADSGLDPSRLELEITETVMLDDTDAILVILHKLRDLGIGIAMDDFGTGYSSLSYLRRFPFTKVKIDRSFIEGLGRGGDCDAIVTAVTDLCDTLGMIALAEGVETEDQLQRLRAGKCGEAQGYLFSRPRPAGEVAALCRVLTPPELAEAAV
jgi:diguanylate cyclase (GGDEF)-like protein